MLEALALHVQRLEGPWRAEVRANGSFRVLYGGGKVAYWQSAQRPLRVFVDAADVPDTAAFTEFATVRPPYKNKLGLPIDLEDFDAFIKWISEFAPRRPLRTFHERRATALSNPPVTVWK